MTTTTTPPGPPAEPPPSPPPNPPPAPPPSPAPAEPPPLQPTRPEGRPAPDHRRRVPTVLQMESVECGAAALAMVLAHHGRVVPLEELRVACGVSRDGANAANLLRAARRYGLEAAGYKMETAAALSSDKPIVVFWAFQHFMVVEGVRTRRGRTMVLLNDPGMGRREMTLEEFDGGFTGIALTFRPGEDFARDGARPGLLPSLLRRRHPDRRTLALVVLGGLLLAAPGLLVPGLVRLFVDEFLVGGATGTLGPVLVGLGAAAAVTGVLTTVVLGHSARLTAAAALQTTSRLVAHLLTLPLIFFDQRRAAELAKRASAADTLTSFAVGDLTVLAVDAVVVALYATVLLSLDVVVGLVGLALTVVTVVVLERMARSRADVVAKRRVEEGNLAAATVNTVRAVETVKASGLEDDVFARWAGFQAKVVASEQRLAPGAARGAAVPVLLAGIGSGALLVVGGLRAVDGLLTVGALVALQLLLGIVHHPVVRAGRTLARARDLGADLTRVADIEGHLPAREFRAEEAEPAGADPVAEPVEAHRTESAATAVPVPVPAPEAPRERSAGGLEVRHLVYGHAALAKPLIDDLSFTVGPGQRVALVGGSGSGKSTIGRLVAGLYEAWSGDIVVGGRSRAEHGRRALAASVAYVDQDVYLAAGTVRENLTLWDESVPDEAIVSALRDAGLYEALAARPGGLSGRVAEGGRNFSGGQRQRLAIARALVRRPTLLVLDEAMSALDPETEQVVDDNLRRRGCACLIIAHRLSTVRDADEILVLRDGDIVARGRHRWLVAEDGPYRELIGAPR